MKRLFLILAASVLPLLDAGSAAAADLLPWTDHAGPYSFRFGNEIDSHQQTRRTKNGLSGFFYIEFTGVVTKDGYRVATHVDCNAVNDCTVGWTLDGAPLDGAFLYQVDGDHPVFQVARLDIPEPGAYSHFHWLDYAGMMPPVGVSVPGYLLQLTAVDSFCFIHDSAGNASGKSTCHDNGGIAVNSGIDIATHLNIVTSAPAACTSGQ